MKLAAYLEAEGLTATEFAGRVGRSIATISRIARGLHAPDWPTMRAIAEATGGRVMPNDFVSRPASETPTGEAPGDAPPDTRAPAAA